MAFFSTSTHAQPSGGASVTFPTQDESGNGLVLRGVLWTPPDVARGAVILVHGSIGWSDFREGHYGRALSAAGYAVLAIDTYGPRGIVRTNEDQSQITPFQMTRDAFYARRFLLEKGFAADRLALMGASRGGSVALFAADRNFIREESGRFPVAIALYPGCTVKARNPKPASVIFMALGEKDDYTGVKPCESIADDYIKAGGMITVKIYPDASHGFDGNPEHTAMYYMRSAESYIDCTILVEEDGQGSYAGKMYGPHEPALNVMRADMRRTCVKKGAALWTNLREKKLVTRDIIEFLNKTIGT